MTKQGSGAWWCLSAFGLVVAACGGNDGDGESDVGSDVAADAAPDTGSDDRSDVGSDVGPEVVSDTGSDDRSDVGSPHECYECNGFGYCSPIQSAGVGCVSGDGSLGDTCDDNTDCMGGVGVVCLLPYDGAVLGSCSPACNDDLDCPSGAECAADTDGFGGADHCLWECGRCPTA